MKLSELNPSKHKKVLVYGLSGEGKTVFACGFPTPIRFFDFDGKVSSAASFYHADGERRANIDFDTYLPKAGEEADKPFVRYHTDLAALEKQVKEGSFKYETVVLDSLTTYFDQMLKEVVRQNPGVKRQVTQMSQVASLQDYMIAAPHFKNLLTRLLQLPANVVVTAHVHTTKDEITGEIIREPLLPGKLAAYLPVVFEEVYRTYTESKDGAIRYLAQTQSDSRFKCRSQIRGLPASVALSYSELAKYFPKVSTGG
jgi:hypothetical protein